MSHVRKDGVGSLYSLQRQEMCCPAQCLPLLHIHSLHSEEDLGGMLTTCALLTESLIISLIPGMGRNLNLPTVVISSMPKVEGGTFWSGTCIWKGLCIV